MQESQLFMGGNSLKISMQILRLGIEQKFKELRLKDSWQGGSSNYTLSTLLLGYSSLKLNNRQIAGYLA